MVMELIGFLHAFMILEPSNSTHVDHIDDRNAVGRAFGETTQIWREWLAPSDVSDMDMCT